MNLVNLEHAGGDGLGDDGPLATSDARAVALLGVDELGAVDAVGQRLRAEMGRLVRALPAESRSVRTMAAALGVDRNTCQRVIAATQPATTGCEAFLRLPGVKPMRQLVARARGCGVPDDVADSVSVAIDRLQAVIEDFGQSHRRLRSRVEATLIAGTHRPDRSQADIRRTLFEEHARLLGRQMSVYSMVTAIVPQPGGTDSLEQAWMRGLIGLKVNPQAGPVPLGLAATEEDAEASAVFDPLSRPTAPGGRAAGIIAALSSAPAPTLTARVAPASQVMVIDAATLSAAGPTDVVVGSRMSGVARPDKIYHTSTVMMTPAARLVFDVYLHRSLAMASVPSCGVFQYTMSFTGDMDANWPFRLPGQHRMELLGRGLGNSDSPAWGRHAEATRHLFAMTGWPADEFVGHRMDIPFPLWGSTAYQWFDFRTSQDG